MTITFPFTFWGVILTLTVQISISTPIQAQCNYEVTFLDGLLCPDGRVLGFGVIDIDEQGNMSGGTACGLTPQAAVWRVGEGPSWLPVPPTVSNSKALALTDPDHIVGVYVPPAVGGYVAAYWEFGTFIDLGTLPGDFLSRANGINQSLQIVGLSSGATTGQAFLWENGNFQALNGFPIGPFSVANDINDHGQIVGWMGGAPYQSNAFLWDEGVVFDLGKIPGGNSADAQAINNRGHVAGVGWVPREGTIFGSPHAFFWDGQTMIDLGTLPGDTDSVAYDLNDADQIVGYSFLSGRGTLAVLWHEGQMYELSDLVVSEIEGFKILEVEGINNDGLIVVHSDWGAALLTPIGSAPGDVDNNCVVNVSDLLLVLGEWGNANSIADINDDGIVNVLDLLQLLADWG